jgi:hypothetical protein
MKFDLTDEIIMTTPIAEGAAVFFCPNPDCNQPHLLLLDEDDQPMAHFVIADDFFQELVNAMQRRKNQ